MELWSSKCLSFLFSCALLFPFLGCFWMELGFYFDFSILQYCWCTRFHLITVYIMGKWLSLLFIYLFMPIYHFQTINNGLTYVNSLKALKILTKSNTHLWVSGVRGSLCRPGSRWCDADYGSLSREGRGRMNKRGAMPKRRTDDAWWPTDHVLMHLECHGGGRIGKTQRRTTGRMRIRLSARVKRL